MPPPHLTGEDTGLPATARMVDDAHDHQRPLFDADSTGRCNGLVKSLSRRIEVQGLPRTPVEPPGYGVEPRLRLVGEIGSLGEVLSQQPVRVLVRTALPGILRVTKVDLDIGRYCEALDR